jgi:pimeloyl-ACP methyl ester carboxylesterase
MTDAFGYRDLFFSAPDGLRLHCRDYGDPASPLLPVLCLPGLSRNASDFHDLALRLGAGPARRRVLAVDYRGRGQSAFDPDWTHYDIGVELGDALALLKELSIGKVIVIGTSRGGLIGMTWATLEPQRMAGLVLNDIGPVLEPLGLSRIKSYVGRLPAPESWEAAVALLKTTNVGFDAMPDSEWLAMARGTWRDRLPHEGTGPLVLTYDPALMKPFDALDLEQPLPDLWPVYDALAGLPLLVIRGANSDLLSESTTNEMAQRHSRCAIHVVPGQGHAPLLRDEPTLDRIATFVAAVDPA